MSPKKLSEFVRMCVLCSVMLPLTQSILFHNKLEKFGDKSVDQIKINETTAFTKNVRTEVLEKSECKCQNGKCVSQGNQEVCVCDPGFGKIGSSTCVDCKCGKGFHCTFDVGILSNSKKCLCSKGFVEKDGVCKECDCGDNGECEIGRAGEKICKCKNGYFVSNGKCEDCKCGLNNTKCELIETIKICSCPKGYKDSRGVCKDIDECMFKTLCPPHTKCINTLGSYECACEEGYEPKSNLSDTRVDGCQDIDECLLKETCSFPSTKCVNLPGSYKCICLIGFQPINRYGDPRYTRCRDGTQQNLSLGFSGWTLHVRGILFYSICLRARRCSTEIESRQIHMEERICRSLAFLSGPCVKLPWKPLFGSKGGLNILQFFVHILGSLKLGGPVLLIRLTRR